MSSVSSILSSVSSEASLPPGASINRDEVDYPATDLAITRPLATSTPGFEFNIPAPSSSPHGYGCNAPAPPPISTISSAHGHENGTPAPPLPTSSYGHENGTPALPPNSIPSSAHGHGHDAPAPLPTDKIPSGPQPIPSSPSAHESGYEIAEPHPTGIISHAPEPVPSSPFVHGHSHPAPPPIVSTATTGPENMPSSSAYEHSQPSPPPAENTTFISSIDQPTISAYGHNPSPPSAAVSAATMAPVSTPAIWSHGSYDHTSSSPAVDSNDHTSSYSPAVDSTMPTPVVAVTGPMTGYTYAAPTGHYRYPTTLSVVDVGGSKTAGGMARASGSPVEYSSSAASFGGPRGVVAVVVSLLVGLLIPLV
ncbi:hypothetical protein E6O75_ATG05390 [Venturia nashicola]|uniref:Uncharacterized protein n=1 Tax=Venturia nashicola TaxID=86259 RepID=A0A4Z1P7I6_9PEZI|nr:hypothetical protein E6O75_ATG05390 [Venturia nashicola]